MRTSMLVPAMLADFKQVFCCVLYKWCLAYRRALALKRLSAYK
jgi:hypothetical protein